MTNATLCFLDTETTGLDPDRHEIWEVAMIRREGDGTETEYVWQLPVDLSKADPIALNIGRFHERRWPRPSTEDHGRVAQEGFWRFSTLDPSQVAGDDMGEWAGEFVELTRGAHLVGNVVSFDAERLWKLLRRLGQCPMWHYHLVDVEALAVGWLSGAMAQEGGDRPSEIQLPWDSDKLSAALGVTVAEEDRHTALGDARWAKAMFDAVMGDR